MNVVPDAQVPEKTQWLYDCIERVSRAYDEFSEANNPVAAAYALVTLNDRLHDLRTYHPGYDFNTGTMPYDREDEE